MSEPKLTKKSFSMLRALKANNNREWFKERKEEFAERVQDPFLAIMEEASLRMKKCHFPMTGTKRTMFRIYRDVRFSKDKSPYREHISGLLSPSGEKYQDLGQMYLHLDTDGGFIACGFYRLEPDMLNRIRDAIIEDDKEFDKIRKRLAKKGFDFFDMGVLKRMPRGYQEYSEHMHADVLKRKSLIMFKRQTKQAWLDGSIVDEIVAVNKATADFFAFGMFALDGHKLLA